MQRLAGVKWPVVDAYGAGVPTQESVEIPSS
jgi:hypothetical protein